MAPIRLAELLGRLSLAFDIANDSPHGKAVRSAVLATELGAVAGATTEEMRDAYWVTLFAYLGCTGFAHEEGLMGAGDDRSVRNAIQLFSLDDPLGSTLGVLRRIAPESSFGRRLQVVAGMLTDRTLLDRFQSAMCETSIRLAEIIGAGPRILDALRELCERWDGRGAPGQVRGDALALPMRLAQMGHVLEVVHHRDGRAAAVAVAEQRAGGQFDPRLVAALVENQGALFAAIEDPEVLARFLRLEPRPIAWADERRTDDLARALGIFADLKSPTFLGHSTGVAALAERAAGQLGLGAEETRTLRWAALLHDLGRLSVPNGIWTRPGPLDWSARERVRLHSYHTERVLAPIQALASVAHVAGAAHERIDGSGYHQRRIGKSLCTAARILAAADMAFAMSEDRPHRPALKANAIARELVAEAGGGRLDPTAVDAVLASLGMPDRAVRSVTHGLSERELDVLRLLARGKTNKEIGHQLGISPRTVQIHVSHILHKLGVHSRSGAAIWLVERDLAN
ncbi:MAG: HD domain-containing protein [Myxococcales bacterium]|nr:HD domain-containing protein [Myxococcales bacterium]